METVLFAINKTNYKKLSLFYRPTTRLTTDTTRLHCTSKVRFSVLGVSARPSAYYFKHAVQTCCSLSRYSRIYSYNMMLIVSSACSDRRRGVPTYAVGLRTATATILGFTEKLRIMWRCYILLCNTLWYAQKACNSSITAKPTIAAVSQVDHHIE